MIVYENPLRDLPKGPQKIVNHIVDNFEKYHILTPLQARKELAKQLIEDEGWDWNEVWSNIKVLRQILNF